MGGLTINKLLIRFLPDGFRFKAKIVLPHTHSSLWYTHALVSPVGFGKLKYSVNDLAELKPKGTKINVLVVMFLAALPA